MVNINFGIVEGLPNDEQKKLNKLEWIYNYHKSKNSIKDQYYEGHIGLSEVNLGIALPTSLSRLSIGCEWGAKCVDVLASRSMFDGFVAENGMDSNVMNDIISRNHLIHEYNKVVKEELKFGAAFVAVSGTVGNAKINFYSEKCAAAEWDSETGTIDCGICFVDLREDESDVTWTPDHVNLYTKTDIWELTRTGGSWKAERHEHKFGVPLMVPLAWNATSDKPFGQSRLRKPVRSLIEGYVRTVANATIGLEFATSPQKYLLGVTDDQFDAVIDDKFRQYVGSIMTSTANPDTGTNPVFGQLPQGNIEPHVAMLRILATQFSAATGLTVTDTGVVNDANPTSSDAILAQSQTLVLMAEQLNAGNGQALYQIAVMALAIELGTTPAELPDEYKAVMPHFKNPAMPSVAVTADAAIKIASAREGFGSTDTFLEMIGFSQADIRRIRAQEQRARGLAVLTEFEETPESEQTEQTE